jgi:hypothetical protein
MLDTQILVHMKNGKRRPQQDFAIASVSANEFLFAYDQSNPKVARYYVPLYFGRGHRLTPPGGQMQPSNHFSRRHRTDRIVIDFNNQHPPMVEYGSVAIAAAINNQNVRLFDYATEHLPKQDKRSIKDRFVFLMQQRVRCVALDETTIEVGLELLSKFLEVHSPKGEFRNTVCDRLILAVAQKHGLTFRTEDCLLQRFAASRHGAPTRHADDDLVIDFAAASPHPTRNSGESKGFIHRGWQIAVERQHRPA